MRSNVLTILAFTSPVLAGGVSCSRAVDRVPRVLANDNRAGGGVLENGVLTLALEAREGRWYPDGDSGPSLVMQVFAEAGEAPRNPGPMIRVPSGTIVKVSVRSLLADSTLVVYGLHTHPGDTGDTIQVAPGATRDISFAAGEPGTYFYWGRTTDDSMHTRNGIDSQLHGAFIVDPPGGPAQPDRVFVLGSWSGKFDRRLGYGAELRVINGLSWPHTERMTYTAGDTVVWRWVNPTDSPHPMHLHGFYFDVVSRGNWAADTMLSGDNRSRVVTEMPRPGQAFAMQWVPEEPGNWLVHCHVAFHTSMYLAADRVADPADPVTVDHHHGMRGMVMALTVNPGVSTARRPEGDSTARHIRLVAQAAPRRYRSELDEMAFVQQVGTSEPAPDSVPAPSSLLLLKRGEPVRFTIVNRLRTSTGVHWHGIEVPAYSDGVPDWSGSGSRRSPAIAPGDSFTVGFTPTRSGTFIYHAHSNETFQISLGLYGGLLVVDDPAAYDPERDRLIIISSAGPNGAAGARFNGSLTRDTLRLTAGTTYRLRLIHLVEDFTTWVALLRGDTPEQWTPVAKDGADLPASRQVQRRAALLSGPGETTDFDYTPTEPGVLRLEVEQRTGAWTSSLPIVVTPKDAPAGAGISTSRAARPRARAG
jgi:FtsP/CotA-like multicopper oxidase with cupredoxin domain